MVTHRRWSIATDTGHCPRTAPPSCRRSRHFQCWICPNSPRGLHRIVSWGARGERGAEELTQQKDLWHQVIVELPQDAMLGLGVMHRLLDPHDRVYSGRSERSMLAWLILNLLIVGGSRLVSIDMMGPSEESVPNGHGVMFGNDALRKAPSDPFRPLMSVRELWNENSRWELSAAGPMRYGRF